MFKDWIDMTDTWIFYARVALSDTPAKVWDYIEYAEHEGFTVLYTCHKDEDDGTRTAGVLFSKNTDIIVTGTHYRDRYNELQFEPDELDEDLKEWIDPLNLKGITIEDAWFGLNFRRGRLKPLTNPLKGIPPSASTG